MSRNLFGSLTCLYKEWPFFLASYRLPKTINHGLNSSRVPRRLLNHSLLPSFPPEVPWALQRGIVVGSRRFAYGFAGSSRTWSGGGRA